MSNHVFSMYYGDTYLDIYGYEDADEPNVGHVGGVEIEDVKISGTDISVLEMICGLDWDKFEAKVQEEYLESDHA